MLMVLRNLSLGPVRLRFLVLRVFRVSGLGYWFLGIVRFGVLGIRLFWVWCFYGKGLLVFKG